MQLIDQAPVGREELGVAGELDQPVVELQVGAMVRVEFVARSGLVHAFDQRTQFADVRCGGLLRDAAARELVERGAQFIDFVCFLQADLADEDATVLLESHQAGLLERTERLAHRAPRNAQHLGDRRFVQLGAGGEIAAQDHSLQFALHQHGQRIGLEKGDDAVGHRRGVGPRVPAPARATGFGQSGISACCD